MADGSFALDQSTVNVPSESEESDGEKELENYEMTGDDGGTESDTIALHSVSTEGTVYSKKRKHIQSKYMPRGRTRRGNMNDQVSASLVRLCDAITHGKAAESDGNKIKNNEPLPDPNASMEAHRKSHNHSEGQD